MTWLFFVSVAQQDYGLFCRWQEVGRMGSASLDGEDGSASLDGEDGSASLDGSDG